jgi:4-diphosphocytidyl-2-C-methyl-D-erythritol kinase
MKTAELLFEKFSLPGGIDIGLKKNIPIAAGLGGGSSDSAATIYAINELYDLRLSHRDMQKAGFELGSDIPFFFSSGQAEITGRGEIIKDIRLPVDYSIILAVPNIAVSTADSYRRLNLGLTSPDVDVKFPICSDFTGLVAQIGDVANDFERVHCESYPVLGEIKEALLKAGATIVRMSGSGPAMFGLFEKGPDEGSFSQIARGNWRTFGVRPINLPAWE